MRSTNSSAESLSRACGFVVAGTHSGVGKTTTTLALMGLLAERGLVVQPFKIGPDFIDPGYHFLATGRASVNLDLWMMGTDGITESFFRYARDADIAVVEAMGGLYDGQQGTSCGSAAHLAGILRLPVLLVVDIWGMTRSTAAMIRGFEEFDPSVEIAAVVLNRAGSHRHVDMVLDSVPDEVRRKVIGYIPADDGVAIRERHLGLVTTEENPAPQQMFEALLGKTRATLFVDKLLDRTRREPRADSATLISRAPMERRVRIGIARDRAFCFYYRENLRQLEDAGAELVPFSPMADRRLPESLGGIYLGGGYPESFARQLASNEDMKRELASFAARGGWIYAECGGFMYIGERLTDFDGRCYPMVGLLPIETVMDRSHLSIRYVEVRTRKVSPLGPTNTVVRGQEFHQSRLVRWEPRSALYDVRDSAGNTTVDGMARANVIGSYAHLYFGSNPAIVHNLMSACG